MPRFELAGKRSLPLDAAFINNMPHMLNLVTKYGDMDLTFTPAGALKDYEAWRVRSASPIRTDLL